MNVWGFGQQLLPCLEEGFRQFLQGPLADPLKAEYYLPAAVDGLVHQGKAQVQVLRTASEWFGVTYPEDKQMVKDAPAPSPRARAVSGPAVRKAFCRRGRGEAHPFPPAGEVQSWKGIKPCPLRCGCRRAVVRMGGSANLQHSAAGSPYKRQGGTGQNFSVKAENSLTKWAEDARMNIVHNEVQQ